MTISEKILARGAGRQEVFPGEILETTVDMTLSHEKTGPPLFKEFDDLGVPLWDVDKVAIFSDHEIPPGNIFSADLIQMTLEFCRKHGIENYYHGLGISHQILPDLGFVMPGEILVGTDSHMTMHGALGAFSTGIGSTEMVWVYAKGTLWLKVPETIRFNIEGSLGAGVMGKDLILKIISLLGLDGATYKAMEFAGSTVDEMSMDSRMAVCNMAVEAGAKNGIMTADEKTFRYLKGRARRPYTPVQGDPNAHFSRVIDLNVSTLEPQVACPHSVDNVHGISEVKGIRINRGFVGTCTGGRLEDLHICAQVLKGRKVHRDVMLVVIPASQQIYLQAIKVGIVETLLESGALFCNASCGPCGGGQMGVLGKKDVCVSASNRNFKGRQGDPNSQVYLGNPAMVAASCIRGELADPREYL
jgi:homoaconitate hydratase family protein